MCLLLNNLIHQKKIFSTVIFLYDLLYGKVYFSEAAYIGPKKAPPRTVFWISEIDLFTKKLMIK